MSKPARPDTENRFHQNPLLRERLRQEESSAAAYLATLQETARQSGGKQSVWSLSTIPLRNSEPTLIRTRSLLTVGYDSPLPSIPDWYLLMINRNGQPTLRTLQPHPNHQTRGVDHANFLAHFGKLPIVSIDRVDNPVPNSAITLKNKFLLINRTHLLPSAFWQFFYGSAFAPSYCEIVEVTVGR